MSYPIHVPAGPLFRENVDPAYMPPNLYDLAWGRWQERGGFQPGGWGVYSLDRTQRGGEAPAGMLTETEWRYSVVWSRHLCDRNMLAIGFLTHIRSFVLGDGYKWQVTLRGQKPGAVSTGVADMDGDGNPDGPDPSVARCQQVLDEWKDLVGWGDGACRINADMLDGPDDSPQTDREAESLIRWIRDGETLLRFFAGNANTNGLPLVRHIEPEQVRSPDGSTGWEWGIETDPIDDERRLRYWVCDLDDPLRGEAVPAGRIAHLKGNVDATQPRGVSDFFPVAEPLDDCRITNRNMVKVAGIQSAIAWVIEHAPYTTSSQVMSSIQAGGDYTGLRGSVEGDRTRKVQFTDAGQAYHVSAGQTWLPGPVQSGAQSFVTAVQASLRAVGLRWGCPEYFSGDASNANFASTLVSGGPFERAVKFRQKAFRSWQQSVAMRVLAFAVRSGRISDADFRRVTVHVIAPGVAISDQGQETNRCETLFKNKVLSPQTWCQKEGYDPKIEAANWKAWDAQNQDQGEGKEGGDGDGGGNLLEGEAYSESAYRRLTIESRDGLVKKTVTDKNGDKRTVWVRTGRSVDGDVESFGKIVGKVTHHHVAVAYQWVDASEGIDDNTKQKYAWDMAHALAALPEPAFQKAKQNLSETRGVVFYQTIQELRDTFTEAAREAGSDRDFSQSLGISVPYGEKGEEIHVDGGEYARDVYVHELWHGIDANNVISEKPEWESAYRSDILNQSKKPDFPLGEAAIVDQHEGFAELGRLLAAVGRKQVERSLPNCIKFLESEGLL